MTIPEFWWEVSAQVGTTVLIVLVIVLHPMMAHADAVSKAKCVRQAVKSAAKVISPEKPYTGAPISPEVHAKARKEAEAFYEASRAGLQKCLTADDVYQLGWFYYLQLAAPMCAIRKTDALKNFYMEDNLESDLFGGAIAWQRYDTDVNNQPFFRGQDDARVRFSQEPNIKLRAEQMCNEIFRGFGPKGDQFPGLVRRP